MRSQPHPLDRPLPHSDPDKNGKTESVWVEWHVNGQKSAERTYKDGKKEGVWTTWDDKGNVTKTETYKNGELVK